jgi:hypothetical protein
MVAALSFSYNGFCLSQMRFLSNQEYFESAISEIIQRNSEQLITYSSSGALFRSIRTVRYASAEEFHRQNANCCKMIPHNVGDEGPYTTFSQRLFGYAATIVSGTWLVNYVDEAGDPKSEQKTQQFAVTNCDRAWHATH